MDGLMKKSKALLKSARLNGSSIDRRRHLSTATTWTLAVSLAAACSGRTSSPETSNDAGIVQQDAHDATASEAGDASVDIDSGSTSGDAGGIGACAPAPAPLRRLSSFEYANTVRDLLHLPTASFVLAGDAVGANGFGNAADGRDVSAIVVEGYHSAAKQLAQQTTASEAAMAVIAPCAATLTDATWDACARATLTSLAKTAYRRTLSAEDEDALLALHTQVHQDGATFAEATAVVIEALLQSPEFLYRVELGTEDPALAGTVRARRPSGEEMAARLSYLLWGSQPDDALLSSAASGELQTAAGIRAQALRMLDDPRAHQLVRHFVDKLFRLEFLSDIARDPSVYPSYTAAIGSAMREETLTFADNEVFAVGGTWPSLLTAPYTFVNEPLATYYGMTGVAGTEFRKVELDTTRRLGLLTQGGIMAALTPGNRTNPVARGTFVANRLLCRAIPPEDPALPPFIPPGNPSDKTTRARVTTATDSPVCLTCHNTLNTLGFALEHYDAVGLYREQENGESIDAQVTVPGLGPINGGVELARALAQSAEAQSCFADQWVAYAYGTALRGADACLTQTVRDAFQRSGFNIKQLLIDLTQTDAFQFLPASKE
jgi:hypothetical protein